MSTLLITQSKKIKKRIQPKKPINKIQQVEVLFPEEITEAQELIEIEADIPPEYSDEELKEKELMFKLMERKLKFDLHGNTSDSTYSSTYLAKNSIVNHYRIKFDIIFVEFTKHKGYTFNTKIIQSEDYKNECKAFSRPPLIILSSLNLRKGLEILIDRINNIAFCRSCGKFCQRSEYSSIKEECLHCLFQTTINLGTSTNKEQCVICGDDCVLHYKLTKCGHRFHRKCLSPLDKMVCPLCRAEIETLL